MYDIGLKSGKSLFQLLMERIMKLGQLAASASDDDANDTKIADRTCIIPFYIMTSPLNHDETKAFFESHDYFGADAAHVVFFQQGMLPCMSPPPDGGKILMETKSKVSMAPDGNGGIYPSLQASGALDDMVQRGVLYLNVFSIDNALVKPADPAFVGYCIRQMSDCGNKSVWKAHAHEQVGVVAARGGRPCIVEYSEITKEMAERTDPQRDGRLVFGAGNICNHFYTIDFLRNEIIPNMSHLYHVAHKKIAVYDPVQDQTMVPESNNGIKLEAFIFDVFPMAKRMAIWEVERAQEFAPVKNAPGCNTSDSPDTARAMISKLAEDWVKKAGATILVPTADSSTCSSSSSSSNAMYPCEVSPLTSYAGEGLENYKGKQLIYPFSI
jgi:UDP-N-acetylglucosamine/UDP-N-acetylgalactosamine diphosphorylase